MQIKISIFPLEAKCKLSPEWTENDIYNFFDFINKIIYSKERRRRRRLEEFDPLSWNLSNGKTTQQREN